MPPTPPAPPCTSSRSPGCTSRLSCSATIAVNPASAIAAASTSDKPSGTGTASLRVERDPLGIGALGARRADTEDLRRPAPDRRLRRRPEPRRQSRGPAHAAGARRGSRCRARVLRSAALRLAARISTRISPGPATGSGRSTRRSTSGPPYSANSIALHRAPFAQPCAVAGGRCARSLTPRRKDHKRQHRQDQRKAQPRKLPFVPARDRLGRQRDQDRPAGQHQPQHHRAHRPARHVADKGHIGLQGAGEDEHAEHGQRDRGDDVLEACRPGSAPGRRRRRTG